MKVKFIEYKNYQEEITKFKIGEKIYIKNNITHMFDEEGTTTEIT